jgi:hypothetical protein
LSILGYEIEISNQKRVGGTSWKIVKRSVIDSWNLDIPQDGTCSHIYMNFSLLFITCPETTASEIHRRLALTGAVVHHHMGPARLCPDSPVRPPPGVWSEVQISKQPSENSGSGGLPGHAHNVPAPVSTQPLNTLRIPSCAQRVLSRDALPSVPIRFQSQMGTSPAKCNKQV